MVDRSMGERDRENDIVWLPPGNEFALSHPTYTPIIFVYSLSNSGRLCTCVLLSDIWGWGLPTH